MSQCGEEIGREYRIFLTKADCIRQALTSASTGKAFWISEQFCVIPCTRLPYNSIFCVKE